MYDCRSGGLQFDPGPVPYFRADGSRSNFYGSSPFRWFKSCKRKYVQEVLVNRLVKLAQEKSVLRWTDRPNMTIAVDWDIKSQTKPKNNWYVFIDSHLADSCRLLSIQCELVHLHLCCLRMMPIKHQFQHHCYIFDCFGVSTQLQSSGLVAHENSTFRNLALAVSGPLMA